MAPNPRSTNALGQKERGHSWRGSASPGLSLRLIQTKQSTVSLALLFTWILRISVNRPPGVFSLQRGGSRRVLSLQRGGSRRVFSLQRGGSRRVLSLQWEGPRAVCSLGKNIKTLC